MSLEDIAKKAYPYTLLATTGGLVWLANNPLFATNFIGPWQNREEIINLASKCLLLSPIEITLGFYIASKIKNPKTTFLEPIVKNKYSFLTVQNLTGAVFIGMAASQNALYHGFLNNCYLGASVNLVYTYFLNTGLSIFEKIKPPYLLNFLKASYLAFDFIFGKKDNTEKLEEKLKEMSLFIIEDTDIPLNILSFVHSKKAEHVSVEKAFTKLDISEKKYQKRNLLTNLANFPLESGEFIKKYLFSTNNIIRATDFFQTLNLSEFISCYESEIQRTKSDDAQLLYALFLDRLAKDKDEVNEKISISRRWRVMRKLKKEFGSGTLKELLEQKANKEWQKVVDRIIQDERFQSTQESIEGKRVYRAGIYPFLKTTIIVKEDEKSVLESELNNLNYLREQVKNTDFEVANALKILDSNGKNYLVERHSNGRRLTELLEEGNYENLSKVIQYLKLIHDKMSVPDNILNPEEELLSILRKAQLNDETKQIIYDGIKATLPNLSTRRVFDCDAHADNWFIAGERIIAIDKPTRKAIPPEYDLNKLLNRGKSLSSKEDLIRIYSPEDEFLFSFYNSSPIKALSYYVFSQTYQQKAEQGLQYLDNAVKDLEILIEKSSDKFSLEEMNKLEGLRGVFKELTTSNSYVLK